MPLNSAFPATKIESPLEFLNIYFNWDNTGILFNLNITDDVNMIS